MVGGLARSGELREGVMRESPLGILGKRGYRSKRTEETLLRYDVTLWRALCRSFSCFPRISIITSFQKKSNRGSTLLASDYSNHCFLDPTAWTNRLRNDK